MKSKKSSRLQINLNFTDKGQAPPLQAYVFSKDGKLLGSAPVEKETAAVRLPAALNGRNVDVILGPQVEKGQPAPTAAALKRMGAYVKPTLYLVEKPELELNIPVEIFPNWCLCFVRGRLVKRVTLPDGTIGEWPICQARVHICEVDYIPLVIAKLPDPLILQLRDDLLEKLKVIPWPVPPIPDPGPLRLAEQIETPQLRSLTTQFSAGQQQSMAALASVTAVSQVRYQLASLANIIQIYLCDFLYLWPFFRKDCLTTVEVDSEGRFSAIIAYDCKDKPDLYFWVEQFHEGAWHTVYKPSIGCGTHWNYDCGTEIVLNLPGAEACQEPPYDIPPGVTLFVLPYAIADTPIWGIPSGAPPAPDGWVRPDGYVNYYHSGGALGWLYDAPFGGTLNFIHDDSYFIPSPGTDIKYYRYSYRRANPGSPNVDANDPTWTPIAASLSRGYRMEYSDRLPTYESYPVGPVTVGSHNGLFEFKPQAPPPRPTDPSTVEAREWTRGNLGETAASWNTLLPAPPLSDDNTTDDAGDFEVKIEVFDSAGNQVMPGASTFRFLARNADGTTTRLATSAEIAGGAYVMLVHVDNNHVSANLPQPSIGGVAASDDCGFLRYEPGDLVHIRYLATHPNDHAVFRFSITRGSHKLNSASTLAPYVETAAASAPTTTSPYNKVGSYYRRNFTPTELVGTCVDAAFAAHLRIFGKATNGRHRLGIDASRLIAFALAEQEEDA